MINNLDRYWYPQNTTAYLSDDGYLYDPQDSIGKHYNNALVELKELSDIKCLILLGEAGSGKTIEMMKEKQRILDQRIAEPKQVLWFNLGKFDEENRLRQEIFKNDVILDWIASDYSLYLFLDSFDEGHLRIETLLNQLSLLPRERLFLRIACRSTIWSVSWEHEIKQLWQEQNCKIYLLAPLQRKDVQRVANEKYKEVMPLTFINKVRFLGVETLARKPITLDLLFQLYDQERGFPQNATELYYHCCLKLCSELNPKRYGRKTEGHLTSEERLAVASRIAAVSIFCKKPFIQKDVSENTSLGEKIIQFDELCGGEESTNTGKVEVGRNEVKETLEMTGLFDLVNDNTLSWADKSFSYFLAALYIQRHKASIDEINNIIYSRGLKSDSVTPQFEKVVVWLVSLMPELFDELLNVNPILLVRSDLSNVSKDKLQKLVKSTLEYYKKPGTPSGFRLDAFQHYHKLKHPVLGKQLNEYITDPKETEFVRCEAFSMARECQAEETREALLKIAIDSSETIHLRSMAMFSLQDMADKQSKLQLKNLLMTIGSMDNDEDDELKGHILKCLWPDSISAAELFPLLTPRKRSNLIGSYYAFINYDLAKHLQVTDIPVIFDWVAANGDEDLKDAESIESAFVQMLLDSLSDSSVFAYFVRWIILRISHFNPIAPGSTELRLAKMIQNDLILRQRIFYAVIAGEKEKLVDLVYSKPAILLREDVPWILKEISDNSDCEKQKYMAQLVSWLVDSDDPKMVCLIYDTLKNQDYLHAYFQWIFGIIQLGSPEAVNLKAQYEKRQEREEKKIVRDVITAIAPAGSVQEEIAARLANFNMGDLLAWRDTDLLLRKSESGNFQEYVLEQNETALPGWAKIDQSMRDQIIQVAVCYVEQWKENPDEWWNKNQFSVKVFSDYRALRLALEYAQDRVAEFDKEIWGKWAPFILSYPIYGNRDKNSDIKRKMIEQFYRTIPEKIIASLMGVIEYENEQGNIRILDEMEYCWDEKLQDAMMKKIEEQKLKPESLTKLLDVLLQQNVAAAFSYAKEIYENAQNCDIRVLTADALLRNGGLSEWESVWISAKNDEVFARALMLMIASQVDYQSYKFMQSLTADNFADIFILLSQLFPYEENENSCEAHFVSPREKAEHFRDSILNRLKAFGSMDAYIAIEKIQRQFPQYKWLAYSLYEVEQNILVKTAKTFSVIDIIQFGTRQVFGAQVKVPEENGQMLIAEEVQGDQEHIKKIQFEEKVLEKNAIKILHLSDLHINSESKPISMIEPLTADLKNGNKDGFDFAKIDYLIISGDITSTGNKAEFDIAYQFISALLPNINVPLERCIIVPGNHDMDWSGGYEYKKGEEISLSDRSNYIHFKKRFDQGIDECYGKRNEVNYKKRFSNFADFYNKIKKKTYPAEVGAEYIWFLDENRNIEIIGFNTSWKIDEGCDKPNINDDALSHCLYSRRQAASPILRIMVVHHPVEGNDKIENDCCLTRLQQSKVKIILHGHIHEEQDYICFHRDEKRKILVAGTGTFGAKSKERPESTPCLYSLIEIDDQKIRVNVRCRQKEGGEWKGWYCWPNASGTGNVYYYDEKLEFA